VVLADQSSGRHRADWTNCVTDYERNVVMNDPNIHTERIAVMPNGLDFGELAPRRPAKRDPRILHAGRLGEYERVRYLIEPLPLVGVHLKIVDNGLQRAKLTALANKVHVSRGTTPHPTLRTSELLHRYFNLDISVSLSRHLPYGICGPGDRATKTPSIVTYGSAAEWIDGSNCLGIADPSPIAELAEPVGGRVGKEADRVGPVSSNEVVGIMTKVYEGGWHFCA
jgi:glycosyltransferase involved in cell wall biosynthesis